MFPVRRRLSTSEQGGSQQGGRHAAESAPQAASRSAQSAGKGAASAVYGSLPQQVCYLSHARLPSVCATARF